MKKLNALLLLFLLLICSCSPQTSYKFLHDQGQITSVSIVSISFDKKEEIIQTELRLISDIDGFMSDLKGVNCNTYFGDPAGITEEGKSASVIKILYENGEYELINWNGQARYTKEKGFNYYCGYNTFDKSQFEALLEKYMGILP